MNLIIPENYDPVLDLRQTQEAIKYIRDTFQKEIGRALHYQEYLLRYSFKKVVV